MPKEESVSKTTWYQITLLAVWGISAVAALSGSFWLTKADWVQAYKANASSTEANMLVSENTVDTRQLQDELLVLREAVTHLDRQNRILMSRLEIVENDSSQFTASVPSSPKMQERVSSQPRTQELPAALDNTQEMREKPDFEGHVFTRVDPYPLKMQGTNRAPTDAEISKALKGL